MQERQTKTKYVAVRVNEDGEFTSVTITRTYTNYLDNQTIVLVDADSIRVVMNACEDALLILEKQ